MAKNSAKCRSPIEQICIDLCEKLIPEREINCADSAPGFAWREVEPAFQIHNGEQVAWVDA